MGGAASLPPSFWVVLLFFLFLLVGLSSFSSFGWSCFITCLLLGRAACSLFHPKVNKWQKMTKNDKKGQNRSKKLKIFYSKFFLIQKFGKSKRAGSAQVLAHRTPTRAHVSTATGRASPQYEFPTFSEHSFRLWGSPISRSVEGRALTREACVGECHGVRVDSSGQLATRCEQ